MGLVFWMLVFIGLLVVWYLESERHLKAVERKGIDRMADESRMKQTYLMKFERRQQKPSRSARWTIKNPTAGKAVGNAEGIGQMTR